MAYLNDDTIEANARFFDGDESKVPKSALTVGVGTVMDAKEVVVVATGQKKAHAVKQIIEGAVSHMWTCSAVQLHEYASLNAYNLSSVQRFLQHGALRRQIHHGIHLGPEGQRLNKSRFEAHVANIYRRPHRQTAATRKRLMRRWTSSPRRWTRTATA